MPTTTATRYVPTPLIGLNDTRSSCIALIHRKSRLAPCGPQAGGVWRDADRREGHRGGGSDDGRQQDTEDREHAGRDRHAHCVVDEGEEQVLADVAHLACDSRRARTIPVRSPFSRVTPAPSWRHPCRPPGDAHICGGQRWRVIDASPRHSDDAALPLELFHHRALLVRQDVRLDLLNSEPPGERLGGRAVIARQHDEANAISLKRLERLRRRSLHGVRDGENPGRPAINAAKDRALRATGEAGHRPAPSGRTRNRRRQPDPIRKMWTASSPCQKTAWPTAKVSACPEEVAQGLVRDERGRHMVGLVIPEGRRMRISAL
jgi:hypothetical protein